MTESWEWFITGFMVGAPAGVLFVAVVAMCCGVRAGIVTQRQKHMVPPPYTRAAFIKKIDDL